MRFAVIQLLGVSLLTLTYPAHASADNALCGNIEFHDNLVVMPEPVPMTLPLADDTRACLRALAHELEERPYVQSLTIIVRMADDDRKNGQAMKLADALSAEVRAAGVSPRRVSAVAPAIGHGQKAGIFFAYSERHRGRAVAKVQTFTGSLLLGRDQRSMAKGASGAKIHAYDRIATGERSVALVTIADGSQMFMWPSTVVRFGKIGLNERYQRAVTIDVTRGEVEMLVSKVGDGAAFELVTGAAVAGVRGTRFRLVADSKRSTRLETLSGEVELKNPAGVESVAAEHGSRAAVGQAPEPARALLPGPGRQTPLRGSFASAPVLSWNSVKGATGYRVELAENTAFTRNPQRFHSQGTSLTLPVAPAAGRWYWRVMAIDADGFVGMPSKIFAFTIARTPTGLGGP